MTPSRSPLGVAIVAAAAVCAVSLALAGAAAASTVAAKRAEARLVAADVAALDARLDQVVATYAAAEQDLAYLRGRTRANRRELALAHDQLLAAQQQLGMRAEALYKQGGGSLLDVLMETGSFEDLLSRADFLRRVGRRDAEIVRSVERFRNGVRGRQAQLDADLAKAERLMAARVERRAEIEKALREREAMLVGIEAEVERLREAAVARAREAAASEEPASTSVSPPDGEGPWWPLIQNAAADNGISARGLYRLMTAESGGVATATNGPYCGLFQYSAATWAGSWNPWRGRDIFDGDAQIRATALAIRLGHGPSWWSSTYAWAFSGG